MSIFRAYDIRGVFGEDLTLNLTEEIGKAFGTYLGGGTIAVGRDVRTSSPQLNRALTKGLLSTGLNVIDVGVVPTPILYFAIHHHRRDGGVMITGSHNPPQYNGFKLCSSETTLYGEEIQEIKKIVEEGDYKTGKGKLSEENAVDDYLNHIKGRIKVERKLKIAVDAGNGTAGMIAPKLYRELGCEVVELYCEPDGRFPNHFPDPTVDENLGDLTTVVRKEKADFGVGFDGDADRAGFVDDNGNIIRGDQALILFSRDVLSRNKNAKIIFEVKCSKALIEEIKKHGGTPLMYRTGHSFIENKLREEKALLAGEMSGHFYFGENYFGFDDGVYAAAKMAEILSKKPEKMSELTASMPKYHSTPEIRVECPDNLKFGIVEEVTKEFIKKKFEVTTVDGARVEFPDGWGLIRASNTQPALILRFEAKTLGRLDEIKKLFLDALAKYPKLKENLKKLGN